MHAARPLVIGLGNEYRSDDAAGLRVARELRSRLPNDIKTIELSGEGTALMEAWKGAAHVILIDAVRSGAAPGTVFRFEAHRRSLPTNFFHYSTHAFGVAEALEVARALNQLSAKLIVYGIEGKNYSAGLTLSREVETAIPEVVNLIFHELASSDERAFRIEHH